MSHKVGNYILKKSLGKGVFGEVFETTKIGQYGIFATKKMNKKCFEKPEEEKRLINEINILKYYHHPNLVGLIDLMKTDNNYYLIMEYCQGGDLNKCLQKYTQKNKRPFSEEIVQHLMRQIITGLNYLHSKNVIHRDLKLDNILLFYNSENDLRSMNILKATAKITDFGFAKILKEEQTGTLIGTPLYMCPGMVAVLSHYTEDYKYNQTADIWSLGVLCYEMIVGKCPFEGKDVMELYNKIKEGNYEIPTYFSHELASFIVSMLVKDENKRPSCKELLKHEFLNKNVKEFQPLNVTKIPGIVSQKGGFIVVNSGIAYPTLNQPNNTKIDIFNNLTPNQQGKVAGENQINNNNNNNHNKSNNQQKINNPPNNAQFVPGHGFNRPNNISKSTPIPYQKYF